MNVNFIIENSNFWISRLRDTYCFGVKFGLYCYSIRCSFHKHEVGE